MMSKIWHLCKMEEPEEDGIYEVRLVSKYELLSSPIETIMEYRRGKWDMRVPSFINEMRVESWRGRY